MHLINGEDKCRKKTNQSHIRKNVQAPRKYMAECTLNMKVKKTITSLNTVTLNIATLFQKSAVNGCSAMGEQSNGNMTDVLVYKVRNHFISPYILTRNEAG